MLIIPKMTENSTKKILYIVTKSVWGGAQKYTFELALAVKKEGYEVIIASGGYGYMAEKTEAEKIPYFQIKNFSRDINILKDVFAFFEIIRLLFRTRPDVIHVSSPKAGGLVGLAWFFYKIHFFFFSKASISSKKPKAIYTPHGWTYLEDRPNWQKFFIKQASRIICLFYDKIICVSEFDYKSALENKITTERKLVKIWNGVNPIFYNFFSKEDARQKIILLADEPFLKKDSLWFGAIGEFTHNKGYEYLIRALRQVNENSAQMVLIGYGEKEEFLRELALKNNLGRHFFVVKNFPEAHLYLKAFDVFLMPSVKEGLPYTLLEAGLASLPTIASKVGGIPEVIEDGQSGFLVKSKDEKSISQAIQKLSSGQTSIIEMGKKARINILEKFSFSRMFAQTKEIYGL